MKQFGGLSIVIGIWMVLAPFVLGYSINAVALWNDIIVGFIVAMIGAYAYNGK